MTTFATQNGLKAYADETGRAGPRVVAGTVGQIRAASDEIHATARSVDELAARLNVFANELGLPHMPEPNPSKQPGPVPNEASLPSLSGAIATLRDARNRLGAAIERLTS